jgi:predicted ester cyclase
MSEKDTENVRRIALEAFNQGRLEVVDEVMSPELDDHATRPPGLPGGRDGVKALITTVRTAFPDLHNEIVHEVTQGDLVVHHIRSTGTMRGDFMGMKATGKDATWDAVHIARVRDGKVVEHWAVQDQLGMLQQLGLAPAPSAVRAA